MKSIAAALLALVASFMLIGTTTGASAHYSHNCCGPVKPSYVYSTAHRVSHVTRYRDVSHTSYVYRTHRIIHITKIRPIVFVHTVTRVHHHTVSIVRARHERMAERLPTRYVYSHSVINTYDCVCGGRRRHCH